MPTPSTRTPVRIARGSYSNLNGSVSDLQDGEISYAEDQDKLYIKEGSSLVALTYTPASPAFTGTITGVNLTLSGNLTVNGTQTIINTQTLDVEDKQIEIGKVSSPSDITADQGGIKLKGATDKTFLWVNTNNAWTSSEHIKIGDNKKLFVGTGNDLQIYTDGSNSTILHNGDGDLLILAEGSGEDIKIKAAENVDLLVNTSEIAVHCDKDGAVQLRHNNVTKLETSAGGVTVTGSVTDDKGDLRKIIKSTKTSAYTLVAADAGKAIYTNSGVTLNNNIFGNGDAVTVINQSGSDITITQGSGVTIFNAADAATGNRTLAGRGMATLWFADPSTAYISGAGLS
jgi:hypothetical protein